MVLSHHTTMLTNTNVGINIEFCKYLIIYFYFCCLTHVRIKKICYICKNAYDLLFYSNHLKRSTVMKKVIVIFSMLLGVLGICNAQTINAPNNVILLKVDHDGTVRKPNDAVIARISSDGDLRDQHNRLLLKMCSNGDIRMPNNVCIGKVESDGTVRKSNNVKLGKVESDGTVRDKDNRKLGTAKDVPVMFAAVYFFFNCL